MLAKAINQHVAYGSYGRKSRNQSRPFQFGTSFGVGRLELL